MENSDRHGFILRRSVRKKAFILKRHLFATNGIYQLFDTLLDMPGNSGRIRQIIQLIAEGVLNQILISQHICLKVKLSCLGDVGYTHILHTIITIMRQKDSAEEQMRAFLVENPKRVLSYA